MNQTTFKATLVKTSEILLVVIFYFFMAQLGFLFSIPPGNVTLIWLPSGLSVASILLFGPRALVGIWLGSFIANLWQTGGGSLNLTSTLLFISGCIAIGSTLQTFVANYLLVRVFPSTKDSFELSLHNILRLLGLMATACLIAATMGVGSLFIAGQVAPASFPSTWLTWWMGDLLGIVVGTPIFIGLGRSITKRSLHNIDPAIMISIGIIISVLLFIFSWTNDAKSFELKFEADSKDIQNSIKTTFEYTIHDLEAAQNLFSVDMEIDRNSFKSFTQQHLYGEHATPGLQGLSWNPYITLAERPVFEASVRKEGFPDFQITERNADGQLISAAPRPGYVVVDFIEPLDSNKPALGFDVSSNPVRLAALTNARDTGKITITAPITLVQDTGNHPGFLIFAPVYKQGVLLETIEDRQANLRGFTVSVIRIDKLVNASIDFLTDKDKEIYIFDMDMPEGKQFIYGFLPQDHNGAAVHPSPSLTPTALQDGYYYSGTITAADRHWMVVIKPEPKAVARGRTSLPWFVLSTGLFVTALSTLYLINSQKSSTAIRRQLDSEKVVAEISQQFMKIDLESKDQIIQNALTSIGGQVGVNRCYLFIYDEQKEEFHFAYEWQMDGVSSSINIGKQFKITDYPQSFNAILQGNIVNISHITDLPQDSPEAKILKAENVQSILNIPVLGENGVLGFIGFDSMHNAPAWQEAEINLLQIVGRIIASGLEHVKREQEILRLNQSLEQRVLERTEALRESQESLQKFLDSASDLIQSVDENGNYLYVNAAWCETLGYTPEEAGQISMFQVIDPPYHEHCVQLMKELIISNSGRTIEVIFRTKEGKPVIVEGNISSHPESNGRFVTQGFFRDITQRKADEIALRESYDRLNITKIALEQAMSVRDEFLAGMSHELRTPLAGILGLSEALQLGVYDKLNEKQEKTIRNIQDSSKHLLELINDILDLSSIEAGKLELKFSPCSLDDICQSSLQLTKGMAHKKKQIVNYDPPSEPLTLNVDARRIKQIIVNMLSNAIKFTHENGEVGLKVEADKPNQQVRLTVWDKGIGIKPENISKLFQPFTQIDSSLGREYSGTGLGLSLVKQLVTLHNGRVEVSSVFGEGSSFTVTLPWTSQNESGASPETGQSQQVQIDNPPAEQPSSSVILVVDDNPLLLNMMSDFLEALKYSTTKAQSGTEVLDIIFKLKPDLVLMDIQMPGLDGLETIRRIRKYVDPKVAGTQIIAVTALAMEGDRERCLDAGANEYISKPVRLHELKDLINHLLESTKQQT